MANPNVKVELTADPSRLVDGFRRSVQASEALEREFAKVERAQRRQAQVQMQAAKEMEASFARRRQAALSFAEGAGRAAMAGGAVLAAGLALSAKAAMDWESAFAGVKKVVDGTPEQIGQLERQLRDLATQMPVTAQEIAGVAEAAGQLGVAREDVAAFTKTAVMLGVTTNLSAEDAATGLARLGNIMGVTNAEVGRAGAALVALGNAGASTEDEILSMALRIAGAGRQIGLSEAQVLGYANALSSLGIEAEAGGTAISRVFLTIEQAARNGGSQLEQFAQVSGMSATAFRDAYAKDAAGALNAFIGGLGKMSESGGNAAATLDKLGLGEIRVRDTLLRASGAADQLAESVDTGTQAWEQNIALVAEASKRFETSESKIKIARNQLNDAAIDIGARVLPAFASLAQGVGAAAETFAGLPGPVKDAATVIGGLAAVLGIVGGAASVAVPKIVALRAALDSMGPRGQAAAAGMSRMGAVLAGPVGIGITAGLTVATLALAKWSHGQAQARAQVEALTQAIQEDNGVIGENVALTVYKQLQDTGIAKVARDLKVDINDLTQASIGNADATARVNEQLDAYYRSIEAAGGNTLVATQNIEALRSEIDDESGAVQKNKAAWEERQKIQKGANDALAKSSAAASDSARAQAILAGSVEDTSESVKALKTALDALNGKTLDMREAERGWQEAIDTATESLDKNGKTLDITNAKGRDNSETLDAMAKSAAERAKAVLDSTGDERAFQRSLTDSRAELVKMAQRFGMSRQAAQKYADSVLAIPKTVTTTVRLVGVEAARQKIAGLARALQQNSGLVAGITGAMARQAGKPLDGTRASGGPVRAGGAYLVGEQRPEIFVPVQDGLILPHVGARVPVAAGGGGGSGPTFNITTSSTTAQELVREAQAAARRERSVRAR